MARTTGRSAAGGSSGSSSSVSAGAGAAATPEKGKRNVTDPASYAERWAPAKATKPEGKRLDFDEERNCNRPGCDHALEHFIPPGAKPGGVTFGKCKNKDCAGGGSFLGFDCKCAACNTYIKKGELCLSLKIAEKKFQNQHIYNCLLDKVPGTDKAKYALKALEKDIGKKCITCAEADSTIKAGDFLLSTADVGTALHYTCARKKRRDYIRVVYEAQDKRHAEYIAKDAGNSAEKKAKLEEANAAVSFSELAPDSDDEIEL